MDDAFVECSGGLYPSVVLAMRRSPLWEATRRAEDLLGAKTRICTSRVPRASPGATTVGKATRMRSK